MHIQRDVDQIRGNRITDEVALFIRRILQQLLTKVITEGVGHQISKVGEGLAEDDVSMFRGTFLQLLLEITATVLILAQAGDFTNEVLETGTSKTINCASQSGMSLAVDCWDSRSTSPRLCLGP